MRSLLVAFCLLVAGAAPAAERPTFSPKLGTQLTLDRELVDAGGRKQTLGETLGGHPALVIFGYDKCPNLCGVTQQAVASDLKKTSLHPADYRALFISIDPEETPADAAAAQDEIASAAGPAGLPAWRFLTSRDGAGAALASEAGLTFDRRKGIDQFVHPIAVIALTPSGRISQVLPALTFTPRDLELALVEASENRLGSIADHIFLLCAGFDSSKGQYTPAIWAALKVASLATLLGLGATVLLAELGEGQVSFGIPFFPQEASSEAGQVDALFYTLLVFSVVLGLALTGLVVGYAVKYRVGSKADRTGKRSRSLPLEMSWTIASLVIAFIFFGWGAALFVRRDHPPADALEINGIGKQWMWEFRQPGGQREINELHVPVGKAVVVSLAAQDVIHSFYVPAFRIKQDAVPGRTTHIWFVATEPGRYHLFCAQYCGTQHSEMGGWVTAMAPEQYAAWLNSQGEGETFAASGEKLFRALGCSGCHGASSKVRAPALDGIFGRPVALDNQQTVIADERYLRDSILNPKKEIAAGYEPVMPSFDGLIDEGELQMLLAYLKSLSPQPTDGARP